MIIFKPSTPRLIACLGLMSGLWLGCAAATARGDGGTLRLRERTGPYEVAVFTAPTPLRAGRVDLSILVQDAGSGEPVRDARVIAVLAPRGRPGDALRLEATSEMATNKLLYAAVFTLPEPGWWDVALTVRGRSGRGVEEPPPVRFALEAAGPLPPWRSDWAWLAWPAGVIGLYVVHRWLVGRPVDSPRAACDNGPGSGRGTNPRGR